MCSCTFHNNISFNELSVMPSGIIDWKPLRGILLESEKRLKSVEFYWLAVKLDFRKWSVHQNFVTSYAESSR